MVIKNLMNKGCCILHEIMNGQMKKRYLTEPYHESPIYSENEKVKQK